MNMRKISTLLLAAAMLGSLAACGDQNPTPSAGPETKQQAQAGSYAGEHLVIWTNLTADAQYDVLNRQFTELADALGVTVDVEKVSFNEMYEKLATAVSSHETPDILHTNFGGSAYLYETGSISPMDGIIDAIGRDDFSSAYLRVLTGQDGQIYGLPDWAMHTSVWYRKDLFQEKSLEVPTTWDEFLTVAQALNADGMSGFNVPLNSTQVAAQTLYEMMCSAGIYFMDPETGEYIFDQEKEQAVKVIDYLVELYRKTSPPAALTWSWGDYRNALAVTGTVAMSLDMGAVIGNAQDNNPDMVEKLGCFDFPGVNGDKAASFGSGYCFAATKQESAERSGLVSDFLTALYTPERAAERALSRPMFAFPSYRPAFELYRSDASVAPFPDEVNYILDAYENGTWYWYGMEAGLNGMSAYIESTGIFGEALQGACDGSYTSEEAYDLINEELMGYAG